MVYMYCLFQSTFNFLQHTMLHKIITGVQCKSGFGFLDFSTVCTSKSARLMPISTGSIDVIFKGHSLYTTADFSKSQTSKIQVQSKYQNPYMLGCIDSPKSIQLSRGVQHSYKVGDKLDSNNWSSCTYHNDSSHLA